MSNFKKNINEPARGDVHIDAPLGNIVTAFTQDAGDFVAGQVFPTVPVLKQTDKYFEIPVGDWFRDEAKKRAPGTESEERTHSLSNSTYECDVWALHENLADQVLANYDSPLQPEREMVEGLALAMLIRKERDWSDTFFTTSLWTTDQTGVASAPSTNQFLQWNDDSSTPIEDIRSGKRRVQARTGRKPNKIVLGREVFDNLLDHPDIVGRLDRGQTTGPAIVQRDALAALFELDQVLVMDAVYNSAVEGATDSIDFIGGKQALLVYAAPSPGLYTPSGGYTFAWNRFGGLMTRVKRMRDEKRESMRLEVQMAFDHKLISADLGQFFATAIA